MSICIGESKGQFDGCIGIDVGSSLIKIAYCSGEGLINFEHFQLEHLDLALPFVQKLLVSMPAAKICLTGSGSMQFMDRLKGMVQRDDISLSGVNEVEALIMGMKFFLEKVPDEIFTFNDQSRQGEGGKDGAKEGYGYGRVVEKHSCKLKGSIYPCVLVNFGTGVAILKLNGQDSYEDITGTSIGGGTFCGLSSVILGKQVSFEEVLKLAEQGDNSKVDLFVEDIFPGDWDKIGVRANVVASSFGKLGTNRTRITEDAVGFEVADAIRAVLYMICYHVASIAYMFACIHRVERIYFSGSFIQGHEARLIFEHVIGYANHLGLFSEEIGLDGAALGNFPQAFTHQSLISAAFNLDRALG